MIVQAFGGASAARAVSQDTSAAMVCTPTTISFNNLIRDRARTSCWEELRLSSVRDKGLNSLAYNPDLCYLVAIVVYVTLASEFFLRLKFNSPFRHVEQPRILEKGQSAVSKNLRVLICAMAFCTLCIFIRLVPKTSYQRSLIYSIHP